METKFKVGESVIVKTFEEMIKDPVVSKNAKIDFRNKWIEYQSSFLGRMNLLSGKKLKIRKIHYDYNFCCYRYYLENSGNWIFNDWMLRKTNIDEKGNFLLEF